ncbi:MAG: hypothetical protein GC136_01335 [Alphaproteobacteria bacterium]|nr:hypothetical protein [Alphaproteobacteria bacterium]
MLGNINRYAWFAGALLQEGGKAISKRFKQAVNAPFINSDQAALADLIEAGLKQANERAKNLQRPETFSVEDTDGLAAVELTWRRSNGAATTTDIDFAGPIKRQENDAILIEVLNGDDVVCTFAVTKGSGLERQTAFAVGFSHKGDNPEYRGAAFMTPPRLVQKGSVFEFSNNSNVSDMVLKAQAYTVGVDGNDAVFKLGLRRDAERRERDRQAVLQWVKNL